MYVSDPADMAANEYSDTGHTLRREVKTVSEQELAGKARHMASLAWLTGAPWDIAVTAAYYEAARMARTHGGYLPRRYASDVVRVCRDTYRRTLSHG